MNVKILVPALLPDFHVLVLKEIASVNVISLYLVNLLGNVFFK